MTNLNNNTTATATIKEREGMLMKKTVKELKTIAKDLGLKGYSSLRRKELIELIADSKKELVSSAPVKEEVIEVLGTIEAGGPETKVEVKSNKEDVKMTKKLALNSYIQHTINGKVFRIEEYLTKNDLDYARLVFRIDITQEKIARTEVQLKFVNDESIYKPISVDAVKALMKEGNRVEKGKEVKAGSIAPNQLKDYEVNVDKNKQFYLTNKGTRGSVKVDSGKSVKQMIRTYETRINGRKFKITEKGNFNNNKLSACDVCGKPKVDDNNKGFLTRNVAVLPERFRNKDICYDCQKALGITKLITAVSKKRKERIAK